MNYHKTHAMSMSALQVLIAEIRKHETELSDIERSLQGTPQIPFKDHTKGMPTWVSTNQCVHKCIYYIHYMYVYMYIHIYIICMYKCIYIYILYVCINVYTYIYYMYV